LIINTASMGFDVSALIAQNKIAIDQVFIERTLAALFLRLAYAVDSILIKSTVWIR